MLPEVLKTAAMFIGGGQTPIEKIASSALKSVREQGIGASQSADKLNILWSGVDIAALLTTNNYHVLTGGYYEGPLGMASKTSLAISRKRENGAIPMGVIFPSKYPDDPLTIKGQLFSATDTADRLKIYNDKSQAFFLMGGGGLGTAEEIFFTLKEEAGYDEVANLRGLAVVAELSLKPRPILVVDPTEKVQQHLQFYFGNIVDQNRRRTDPVMRGLFERVYLFGKSSFRTIKNTKYPGLLRLGNDAKANILTILDRYSGSPVDLPPVETLASLLDNNP